MNQLYRSYPKIHRSRPPLGYPENYQMTIVTKKKHNFPSVYTV